MPPQVDPNYAGSPENPRQPIRFDGYEVDVRSGELRKEGHKVRLQAQPFQLLVLLLRNSGDVVSREDVRRELWPGDTFVDFDQGLAAAVNKIREALSDSADKPRYVQTLPRRGYRFIGRIEPSPPVQIRARLEEVPDVASRAKQNIATNDAIKPARSSSTPTWALGAALFLLGAGIAVALMLFAAKKKSQPPAEPEWNISQFTSYPGETDAPAFSPDGSQIAFGWAPEGHGSDLYVKGLGAESRLQLTHQPAAYIAAAWSPDGTQIALMRLAGPETGLYVVPALGGPLTKLLATTTASDLPAPISWSPDGKWIAYSNQIDGKHGDRAFLFSMETHQGHLFYHDPACVHEASLTFSHDGKQVAWLCARKYNSIDLLVGDPEGRTRRVVRTFTLLTYGICWSRDDSKIITAQQGEGESGLYEVQLSDGQMTRMPEAVGSFHSRWPTQSAKTGSLAWVEWRVRTNLVQLDLQNPSKSPAPVLESSRDDTNASHSPDGKYVAFNSNRSGSSGVWIGDADGKNLMMVAQSGGVPRWSPDSQQIVYSREEAGKHLLYILDIRERVPHRLATRAQNPGSPFWSSDGQWIYFMDEESFRRKYLRCPLSCDNNETLIRDGARAHSMQSTSDGKAWYYIDDEKDDVSKIFREPMRDGHLADREEVKEIPPLDSNASFFVATSGIYFVSAAKPNALGYFSFATAKTSDILKTEKRIGGNFWVSNDGKVALLPQVSDRHLDIMLAEPKP